MGKIVLVSFADTRYKSSLKRLKTLSSMFPFDDRKFYTQNNSLTSQYWKNLKPWLYRRGYGYWSWKANIIQKELSRMNDGDIVFWIDAGVCLNYSPKAIERFKEYVRMLDEQSILAFYQPFIEQEWTKGDILAELGVYDNSDICLSNQLWGGCFFIKKDSVTVELVNQWVELVEINKELVTDKKSRVPNKIHFKENRHDQSIFSVLVKQYPHIELSYYETRTPDLNWEKMIDQPIWSKRSKHMSSTNDKIKNKCLRPWREILHLYFKYLRKYEYIGNYIW